MQAGRQGGGQVALCEEFGGLGEGFAIHQRSGTPLKQERLDSTCPDLSSPTQANALPPTLSPCHPARPPACLPKICPSGGQGRAFQSTASPSQP